MNMFLNLKSNYLIKYAIPDIEKKQGKLSCESIPWENSNIKSKNATKTKEHLTVKFSITQSLQH